MDWMLVWEIAAGVAIGKVVYEAGMNALAVILFMFFRFKGAIRGQSE